MKEYAVLFPGQGSQNTTMIEQYSNEPLFIKTISDSSDILGYNIEEVVKNESKINNTIYTQPIMVATSIGIWRTWLDKKEIYPKFAAGHSLGEYTAMVANNTISLEDCLLLVNHRATMMVNAMDGIEGGMAAILGSNKSDDSLKDIVNTVCKEISGGELTIEPVNYNSKDQIVIAGHKKLIDESAAIFKERGAKRAIVLPVSVAAHSSLMNKCSDNLSKELKNININIGDKVLFPIIHNVDAAIKTDTDGIINTLCKQICNPVLWEDSIEYMHKNNIRNFVEIGPGQVLTGLNIKIFSSKNNSTVLNLPTFSPEKMNTALEELI